MSSEVPPVIAKLYDLILWLLNQIPKFPRSHRFVLGDRSETLVLEILELLIEAAYTRNKTAQLRRAGLQLEKVRYLIRISKDLELLSLRQYEFVSEQIDELGRMVGGWLRHQGCRPMYRILPQKPLRAQMRYPQVLSVH